MSDHKLAEALRLIAWSNDSAWQAQCAREALAAHKAAQAQAVPAEPIDDEALWEMWIDSPSDVLAFARRIERHHGIADGKTSHLVDASKLDSKLNAVAELMRLADDGWNLPPSATKRIAELINAALAAAPKGD